MLNVAFNSNWIWALEIWSSFSRIPFAKWVQLSIISAETQSAPWSNRKVIVQPSHDPPAKCDEMLAHFPETMPVSPLGIIQTKLEHRIGQREVTTASTSIGSDLPQKPLSHSASGTAS